MQFSPIPPPKYAAAWETIIVLHLHVYYITEIEASLLLIPKPFLAWKAPDSEYPFNWGDYPHNNMIVEGISILTFYM
jgi:hypothetical protein